MARWVQLVGKTGAGDLTAEISFERSRNNAAGAELGVFVMIIMVMRLGLALVLAPVDGVLAVLRIRPWYLEARKLDRAKRRHLWRARGWAASAEMLDDISQSLRSGRRLPDGELAQRT
jgi:hypothetical protein